MSNAIPLPATATAALEYGPLSKPRIPDAKSASSHAEAQRIGREFEAMFLSQILQPMFDTLPTDGVFGGGNGEKMFRSMQVDEYGKGIAKAGGIGIADAVAREIIRMQEKASAPAA